MAGARRKLLAAPGSGSQGRGAALAAAQPPHLKHCRDGLGIIQLFEDLAEEAVVAAIIAALACGTSGGARAAAQLPSQQQPSPARKPWRAAAPC